MCDNINKDRNSFGILSSLMEEVGELATEVGIQQGHTNKTPSDDGLLGESVDVILCALDMIRQNFPDVTSKDLKRIAKRKCEKWKNKVDNDYK
jgi:NTP pyrophosphatase (non-canonical NTP hydrolase)